MPLTLLSNFVALFARCLRCALCSLLFIGSVFVQQASYAQQPNHVELDRLTLQWSELEQQRSALEAQWLKREAVLKQQAQLLKVEREALQAVLAEDKTATDDVAQKRKDLLAQQITMEQEQQALEDVLGGQLKAALAIQYRLPPPLQASWQALLDEQSLDDPDNSKRLQLLLQLLSQLEDFESRIARHQTVMELEGQQIQVQQFYLGLSQGWYVDKAGRHAGYGFSSEEGWQWLPHQQLDDLEPQQLLRVLGMMQGQQQAELTALPVQIKGATP